MRKAVWLIPVVILAATCAVAQHQQAALHRIPYTDAVPFAVPPDSITRFAACMGWPDSTTRRIRAAHHYIRRNPTGDRIGETNGVWVWATADGTYRIFRHEWVHIATRSGVHFGPVWATARACGARNIFDLE